MKKKISLFVFALATSTGAFAQDARSAMNQILDGYTLPIFIGLMLTGIVLGLAQQWDNIIDKDNRGTTFTQDTLRWSIPQGEYSFFFYTGEYKIENLDNYHECMLSANTDTIEGRAYIAEKQNYCCSAMFNEKLEYQNPKKVKVVPWSFVQKLNIRLEVEGNISPITSITGELSGVSTSRYLYSRETSGSAIVSEPFTQTGTGWQNCANSIYIFGISPADANILKVSVKMDEENQVFDEVQEIDLSGELKSFTSDEITLDLTLHVGKELVLNKVTIDEWEDSPETEL